MPSRPVTTRRFDLSNIKDNGEKLKEMGAPITVITSSHCMRILSLKTSELLRLLEKARIQENALSTGAECSTSFHERS
jgi:hypothetical protein